MTKWLHKLNCPVVKQTQVYVRLYAHVYSIRMLRQPLYNSCQSITTLQVSTHMAKSQYFFFIHEAIVTWLKFFPRDFIISCSGKNNIWQDVTQRRKNKLQSDGLASVPFQRDKTTTFATKEGLRRLVQCWKTYHKTWMK